MITIRNWEELEDLIAYCNSMLPDPFECTMTRDEYYGKCFNEYSETHGTDTDAEADA